MTSYTLDIGEQSRVGARFISHVRAEVQCAFLAEKKSRKLTQQQIATTLGVNRSVINRQLSGLENMTLRSVAELLWAMGWEPEFGVVKIPASSGVNDTREQEPTDNQPIFGEAPPRAAATSEELRMDSQNISMNNSKLISVTVGST